MHNLRTIKKQCGVMNHDKVYRFLICKNSFLYSLLSQHLNFWSGFAKWTRSKHTAFIYGCIWKHFVVSKFGSVYIFRRLFFFSLSLFFVLLPRSRITNLEIPPLNVFELPTTSHYTFFFFFFSFGAYIWIYLYWSLFIYMGLFGIPIPLYLLPVH